MKRNLGTFSALTAGLLLLNSVPAFGQQQVASVTRGGVTNNKEARKPALATAEEHQAEISRLKSRKSALQKYIVTVEPGSADFLTTSRHIRDIDAKLQELNASLQALAEASRKLTLAPSEYIGRYKAEVKIHVDPSFTGNIKLLVIDRLGQEVFNRTLTNLMRGVNDYTTVVDLVDGKNTVIASSTDDTETSNSLVLLGGSTTPRAADPRTPPPPQDLRTSDKLTVDRHQEIGRSSALTISVDDSINKVRVVVKDPDGNVVDRKDFTLRRGENTIDMSVRLAPGRNVISVSDPDGTDVTEISVDGGAARAPLQSDAEARSAAPQHVALSLGGMVVSQQAQNFNQADPFFGFIAGYTSFRYPFLGGTRWNLRFQGIFTAAGRTAEAGEQTDDAAGNGTGNGTGAQTNDPFKFIASRKTFDLDAHAWIDFFDLNFFTIGPYVAWGASAVMDKNELQGEAVVADQDEDGGADTGEVATEARSDNDLKQFKEAGMLMNLRFGDNGSNNKLLLQAILAHGWYEALKDLDPDDDSRKRFIGKLRIFPEGLSFGLDNKAVTPMFGVEVNAGPGPDQIKFFSGFAVRLKGFSLQ